MLPTFFLFLGALALLAAIVAFWQSARALLGAAPVLTEAAIHSRDRETLLEEKAAVLRSLKDLELDRSLGKIGEADFAMLEAKHRTHAKDILRALAAETSAERAEAEKIIDGILSPSEPQQTKSEIEVSKPPTCAKCATLNDPDAAFCKKCGTSLTS